MKHFLNCLRQMLVPMEFRIARPAWLSQLSDRIARAIESVAGASVVSAQAVEAVAKPQLEATSRQVDPPLTPDGSVAFRERINLLAAAGTDLWRTRRILVQSGFGRLEEKCPLEGMNKPLKRLVSTLEAFKEFGLEIQDHTGDRYVSGQAIMAHFEPAPPELNLDEDTIVDTIMPTIYFDGTIIQMGEVVVGTTDLMNAPRPNSTANAGLANPTSDGKACVAP